MNLLRLIRTAKHEHETKLANKFLDDDDDELEFNDALTLLGH